MKKLYRSIYHLKLKGMFFSDRVSSKRHKPTGMECLGWGRVNSLNAWISNKK